MSGQGHGSLRLRRKRRRGKARSPDPEPVLIAARRPNGPLLPQARAHVAASAAPKRPNVENGHPSATALMPTRKSEPPPRRQARIIAATAEDSDERERERQKLLGRLMSSEGRGAISHAAREYAAAGFDFPRDQAVQLQLLEHFDEGQARLALEALGELLRKEPPLKWPVFEQRLRRLEESAEESETRAAARDLRRALRP